MAVPNRFFTIHSITYTVSTDPGGGSRVKAYAEVDVGGFPQTITSKGATRVAAADVIAVATAEVNDLRYVLHQMGFAVDFGYFYTPDTLPADMRRDG